MKINSESVSVVEADSLLEPPLNFKESWKRSKCFKACLIFAIVAFCLFLLLAAAFTLETLKELDQIQELDSCKINYNDCSKNSNVKDNEIKDLKDKLGKTEDKLARSEKENTALKVQVKNLTDNNTVMKKELTQCMTDLDHDRKVLTFWQVGAGVGGCAALAGGGFGFYELLQYGKCSLSLTDCTKNLADVQSKLITLNKTAEALKEDNKKLNNTVEQLKLENKALGDTVEKLQKEAKNLTDIVEKQQKDIKNLTEIVERQQKDVKNLTDLVEKQQKDIKNLTEVVEKQEKDVKNLTEVVDKQQKDIKSLTDTVEGQKKEIKTLTESNTNLTNENTKLKETVKQQEKTIGDLKQQVKDLEEALNNSSAEIKKLKEENADLKTKNEDLNNQVKTLEGKIINLEKNITDQKKTIEDLEGQKKVLEQNVTDLKKQVQEKETIITGLTADLAKFMQLVKTVTANAKEGSIAVKKGHGPKLTQCFDSSASPNNFNKAEFMAGCKDKASILIEMKTKLTTFGFFLGDKLPDADDKNITTNSAFVYSIENGTYAGTKEDKAAVVFYFSKDSMMNIGAGEIVVSEAKADAGVTFKAGTTFNIANNIYHADNTTTLTQLVAYAVDFP